VSTAEHTTLCKPESLPPEIQSRLKKDFASWAIQEPGNLSATALERWNGDKPPGCPGIAIGRFENAKMPSYAVLLVPQGHAKAGYKLLVFSPKSGESSFEMRAVEQSNDGGPGDFFIRGVRIGKFFDEPSRKKFQVQASEGILLIDAAENEYESDVYFWTNSGYQHHPVDY
jgi:hypothetical protein